MPARFAIEAWDPGYGAAAGEAALTESPVLTDLGVEVPEASWAPRRPAPGTAAAASVLFVDGVRRIDARVWLSGAGSDVAQGICASYAAGAVRSEAARAEIVDARVERGVFARAVEGAEPIEADVGSTRLRFVLVPVPTDQFDQLSFRLQDAMGRLEVDAAEAARARATELVLVDGPLRALHRVPGTVGYVKHHEAGYGAPVVRATLARLAPGERTPVFLMGERFVRYSWYVRLPGAGSDHPLAGVVRCEVAARGSIESIVAGADQVTASLPRFASAAHKDPRAPQNLYPIAGLERALRRRLGEPLLILRALRAAARV
ncbi:MAG: hypothetical protein ACRD0A_01510 [Acidimicrobiales bacterium]